MADVDDVDGIESAEEGPHASDMHEAWVKKTTFFWSATCVALHRLADPASPCHQCDKA